MIDKNGDHAFGLLGMSMGQTSKHGKLKKTTQTLPAACARSETQPGRWTRAGPASNVGRQLQQRTTPWEAQHTKDMHKQANTSTEIKEQLLKKLDMYKNTRGR